MAKPDTDALFEQIAAFSHLLQSLQRAASGKRSKAGVATFLSRQEKTLIHLRDQLQAGTWRGGGYTVIEIKDPKPRRISAAPFADRVVHHALCAVIAPIFERGFIADSYANRVGYGQHRAVARYEHYRDRYRYVLRADIYRYFPSIDLAILKQDLRRRLTCPRTLALLDVIIDGSNPQELVNVLFSGDDLLTAAERRRGLPLGNLTSQLFGNIYLNGFDHYVKEVLRAPYLRYVDDFALFANDRITLERWQNQMANYLDKRRLLLHPRKTFIVETAEPAQFLGYVLHRGGIRTLPDDNVQRFRGRLQSLRARWQNGEQDETAVRQRIQSWIAHAAHADTRRLRRTLFRGGWFDPAIEGLPARAARRFVEQQSAHQSRRQSQQQHPCESEQQQRFPSCQIAPTSEPDGSWAIWAHERAFRAGNAMAAPAVRSGRKTTDGVLSE
jgi:retron-type reverse transcriptase